MNNQRRTAPGKALFIIPPIGCGKNKLMFLGYRIFVRILRLI